MILVELEADLTEYDDTWEDMSNYVVHYTQDGDGESDYWDFMSILSTSQLVGGGPHGLAKSRAPHEAPHLSVCLSEIPVHLLARLRRRRGRYGIGFRKDFIIGNGGGPVWYIERNSPQDRAVEGLIQHAMDNPSTPIASIIWSVTPFIDGMGEFNSGTYRFEWEREWRVIGKLSFNPGDVAMLLIPEAQHSAATKFFADAAKDNAGPEYTCPFIDPLWPRDRIRAALEV